MNVGDKIPEILGIDQDGREIKASDFRGRKIVLYSYPKANTSGCTAEACSLQAHKEELAAAGYEIIGVSKDKQALQKKFAETKGLQFPLIADTETTLLQELGCWGEKVTCGRKTIDAPRIQHFVKVHDFARMIAVAEGMNEEDLFVLEAAAILHDVGIHVSEAKYGNGDGKHQEELGPDEARKVLSEIDGFTAAQIERICWLIAHHHTYKDVTSLDHRILLEADFLVNSFEAHLAPEAIITFRNHVFRSESAISMLNDMWGLE